VEPVRRLRATPEGQHSWSAGPPLLVEGFNTQLNFTTCSGAVATSAKHIFFSRVSASHGYVIDGIASDGSVTPNAIPSPFPYAQCQADLALNVSADETQAWVGGWIPYDSTVQPNSFFAASWDGSKWTRFNDIDLGDTGGVGQSIGWDKGLVLVVPEWDTWLLSFATLRSSSSLPPTPKPPVISTFSASAATIIDGQSSSLQWSVSGATSLSIDQGVGTVTGSSVSVKPSKSTTYTLTATNAAGSSSASFTLTVLPPVAAKPLIKSFTATPDSITKGDSSTLAWDVSDASSLSINQNIGSVTGTNSKDVAPSATKTYTLTAKNAKGSVSAKATVTVTPIPKPLITRFDASPASITAGQSSTLSWELSGASSVVINQGIGSVTGSSSKSVSPGSSKTYTLTAKNAGGSSTASVTLSVSPAPSKPVIKSFKASPASISVGQTSSLVWEVSGATSLSINQNIGVVTGTNSRDLSPTVTKTYTLTATNALGSTTAKATITVQPVVVEKPLISSFSASPASISPGQSSTLSWTVTGADSLSLNQGIGTVSGSSHRVSPLVSTTYLLTATNAAGSSTASVTVFLSDSGERKPLVLGYIPAYFFGSGSYLNPEEIDYSTMTHMVFCFINAGGYDGSKTALGQIEGNPATQRGLGGTPPPYTTKQGITYPSVEEAYVGEAHRAGIKAMIVLGGSGDNSGILRAASNPALRATLVKNIVDHMVLADYDGIDIDWENAFPDDWSIVADLLKALRTEANSRPRYQGAKGPVFITFPGYGLYNSGVWEANNQANISRMKLIIDHVDVLNLMTYGLDGSGWWGLDLGL
jgi:hypothetical protein